MLICKVKHKADPKLRYRIMATANMTKIYINLKDYHYEDPNFFLTTYVNKNNRIRDAYIHYMKIWLILS